jgi:hypothetical protein
MNERPIRLFGHLPAPIRTLPPLLHHWHCFRAKSAVDAAAACKTQVDASISNYSTIHHRSRLFE